MEREIPKDVVVASVPPLMIRRLFAAPRLESCAIRSVPPSSIVPPAWVFPLRKLSVPLPFLTSMPLPETSPDKPSVVPAATSTRPACASVTAREMSNVPVVASVPPLNVRPAAAAPRFASRSTRSVPPSIRVPPE
ncbi:hypothetical protein LMG6003_04674 [Achromobacter insolitus]|nr:hypothetical protein LMG6003_04674 [Achromobacter insolitus]